jgi:carboxymethylenebutenolidase
MLALAMISLSSASMPMVAAAAEGNQSASQADWVEIPSKSGRTLRTYVARPGAGDATRAVVVLHENRGLSSWEQGVADRLAAAGFLVVAPDMLSERGPKRGASDSFDSAAAARDAIHALPDELVLADLDATVDFAEGQQTSARRVVMAGFCWGGSQAFRYAAHQPRLAAVINFYGAAPHEEHLAQLSVPVYAFYGELDAQITGDVSRLKNRLQALSKDYAPTIYPGARHGFMRIGKAPDAGPADRKAHDDAWVRLAELLASL